MNQKETIFDKLFDNASHLQIEINHLLDIIKIHEETIQMLASRLKTLEHMVFTEYSIEIDLEKIF